MLKNIVKILIPLLINLTIPPNFHALCSTSCERKIKLDLLTKIVDNLYISENGILYEEVPCDDIYGYRSRYISTTYDNYILNKDFERLRSLTSEIFSNNIAQYRLINAESYNEQKFEWATPDRLVEVQIDRKSNTIQIIESSPIYGTNFIESDRELTPREVFNLKRFLLKRIDSELSEIYGSGYVLIENNNLTLKAKVEHMYGEITETNWEILELNITPIFAAPQRIDIQIVAKLYIRSGLQIRVPRKSSYSLSDDYRVTLEDHVRRLINRLRSKMPNLNLIPYTNSQE